MELELLFPLILVVYAKYTTEKAFDLMASHGIKCSIESLAAFDGWNVEFA